MAWPWWWQVRGSGHALCVTLSGSRCLRGTHVMGFAVGCEARTAEKG